MAWITREGEPVRATQFGMGSRVPGQAQDWDAKGCYYYVKHRGRKVRLAVGDWVLCDEARKVTGVCSDLKFKSAHLWDQSVELPSKPKAPPEAVAVTLAELEAEEDEEEGETIFVAPKTPAKRKRRTKVQMEEARAAKAKADEAAKAGEIQTEDLEQL